jgi:hypothetical protein
MTLVHSTMTATPGTATPGNTYGANSQAALAASITTDQEFLDLGLPENQLMLAYGIIAKGIQGATGSRQTALFLMGWKASSSFRLTQGVSPDQDSIITSWNAMIKSYEGKDDPRSQAMASRLQQDLIALKQYFAQ